MRRHPTSASTASRSRPGRAVGSNASWRSSRPQSVSIRASWMRPVSTSPELRFPDDLDGLAADDQARARRGSGRVPAVGHGADRADPALHPLLPDVVDDRPPAPMDRYERELAVGAWTAGRPCIGRRASERTTGCSSPFSFGPFLGFWSAFDAATQVGAACDSRRRHVEPAAAGDDRHVQADGRCAARRRTRCGWPKSRLSRAACSSAEDIRCTTAAFASSSSRASRAAASRRRAPVSRRPGALA